MAHSRIYQIEEKPVKKYVTVGCIEQEDLPVADHFGICDESCEIELGNFFDVYGKGLENDSPVERNRFESTVTLTEKPIYPTVVAKISKGSTTKPILNSVAKNLKGEEK